MSIFILVILQSTVILDCLIHDYIYIYHNTVIVNLYIIYSKDIIYKMNMILLIYNYVIYYIN